MPSFTILRPSIPYGPRTAVVVGGYRGGTSFVASLLVQLGVPMGDEYAPVVPREDYVSYEDKAIGDAIDDVLSRKKTHEAKANEWTYIRQLIAERNERHDVWGFKKPSSVFIIDQLLSLLRNPHIILITRDPLTTWQSSEIHGGGFAWQGARHHFGCVMDLIEKPRAPTMAISFERAKNDVHAVAEGIVEFLALDGRVSSYGNSVKRVLL